MGCDYPLGDACAAQNSSAMRDIHFQRIVEPDDGICASRQYRRNIPPITTLSDDNERSKGVQAYPFNKILLHGFCQICDVKHNELTLLQDCFLHWIAAGQVDVQAFVAERLQQIQRPCMAGSCMYAHGFSSGELQGNTRRPRILSIISAQPILSPIRCLHCLPLSIRRFHGRCKKRSYFPEKVSSFSLRRLASEHEKPPKKKLKNSEVGVPISTYRGKCEPACKAHTDLAGHLCRFVLNLVFQQRKTKNCAPALGWRTV